MHQGTRDKVVIQLKLMFEILQGRLQEGNDGVFKVTGTL